jgi:hypothetical protein
MPKTKETQEIIEDEGVIIVKNGLGEIRVYEVIGRTDKGLYVTKDKNGLIECFSEFDVGKIKNIRKPNEEEGSGKYK